MATLNNKAVVKIQVRSQEIICPAKQTPKETLYLSNIDDQMGLRNHIPFIHFYPSNYSKALEDPAGIIRNAVSKALVFYYPVAGRLRSADNGKLVVECEGQGVIFRQAIADIGLDQLKANGLKPGFLLWDKLLVDDVWGSEFITDSPLLRLQVTILACGGFVLAYTFNHCICDAYGAFMFMQTVSEFCRNPNQSSPSLQPSWGREILKPRSDPKISFPHPEYDIFTSNFTVSDFKLFAQTSVFISLADVSILKSQLVRVSNNKVPTFDIVAACLWRARTRTLLSKQPRKTTVRFLFPIDTRFRCKPLLPSGYYGSAVIFPCVVAKASEILERPLSYVIGLISRAKIEVSSGDEYRASTLDFIEVYGRRGFCSDDYAFVVSDMTRLRFEGLDFGWGGAVFAGPGRAGTGAVPGMVTSVIRHKSEEGVEGFLAMVSLPPELVERFHVEVRNEIGSVYMANEKLISML